VQRVALVPDLARDGGVRRVVRLGARQLTHDGGFGKGSSHMDDKDFQHLTAGALVRNRVSDQVYLVAGVVEGCVLMVRADAMAQPEEWDMAVAPEDSSAQSAPKPEAPKAEASKPERPRAEATQADAPKPAPRSTS
jgi:hypothetical protein